MSEHHKKHKQHMLRTFRWKNGTLRVVEEFFDKFEDAIKRALSFSGASHKIYDCDGNLCHSGGTPPSDSYA